MDRLIYVAMSGASETLQAMGVNANNLANVNTSGFRADLNSLRSAPLYGDQPVTRIYAVDESNGADLQPGAMLATGRELDIAPSGDAWIAVLAADGGEAYTRAGNLQITASGLLVTASGLPVLGNGGPISLPPSEKLEIGVDGTLSVRTPGAPANTLAAVDRIKLVAGTGQEMRKGEDGLFRLASGATAPADALAQVQSGWLESSNVNSVDALIRMISLARQFETQVQMMKVATENDESTADLLRV